MWKLYIECFTKKYFDFKGRASRREFWSFALFNFIIFSIILIIEVIAIGIHELRGTDPEFVEKCGEIFEKIVRFITFFPSIAITARRAHDINLRYRFVLLSQFSIVFVATLLVNFISKYSETFALIIVILAALPILYIWLLIGFKKGDTHPNRYGDPV
jgi:uncharacterized membrane protein YhaH (DUF805 family)